VRNGPVVTVDGPSGAGKSTVARRLADALGYAYMDTGAMYRGLAFAYRARGNGRPVAAFLETLALQFDFSGHTKVFLDGLDISEEIRSPGVSKLASDLSRDAGVRTYLTVIQRELARSGKVVLEGRDTGSVVFPDAEIKFYLDASPEERARRRHAELAARGSGETMAETMAAMTERDRNDTARDIAPLVVPPGAIRIDTTGMDIDGVVALLAARVRQVAGAGE
jgi:cytidylate kinase